MGKSVTAGAFDINKTATLFWRVNSKQEKTGQCMVPSETGIHYPTYHEVNPPNPEDLVLWCK